MIDHNPKEWIRFIFNASKGDTIRKLFPLMVVIGLYTWGLHWLLIDYFKLGDNNDAKNITAMHSLIGFVISMLLVFRTNTAYDRWWEGRRLWGSLVNSSRNLALKLRSFGISEHEEHRAFFAAMIPNFAFALKEHLRKGVILEEMESTNDIDMVKVVQAGHVPNLIAQLIYLRVNHLFKEGVIQGDQLLMLNSELQSFADVCGACERIHNTPIPFSYAVFLKKFIFIYVLTLPVGFVFTMHLLSIPVVCFVFYVLASLELIAEEIEDPFGVDENDLPTDRIANGIRKSVKDIFY